MGDSDESSSIIAGLWRLPTWGMDAPALAAWTRRVLDLGIDTIDLADVYGGYTVEESFGAALREDAALRDALTIITKCNIKIVNERRPEHTRHVYDSSEAHIVASVENSLRVLGTDRIDVLLLHRQDPLMDPDEVAHAFEELRAAGKVLAFGVSNFTPSHLDALQSRLDTPLVTNQIEVSLLRLDAFEDGTLDQALAHRFRPMAWSPLAGGRLFDAASEHETPARETRVRDALLRVAEQVDAAPDVVAHAFLLRHPSGIRPITGSGRIERIAAAVEATTLTLSREQWFDLWTASTGQSLP